MKTYRSLSILLMLTLLSAPLLVFTPPVQAATGVPDTSWYDGGAGPFEISNADQLAGLAEIVNGGDEFSGKTVILTADIDLADYGNGSAWNGGNGWIPIGNTDTPRYRGNFDGAGHTISNLFIDNSTYQYTGLFGRVTDGTVQNLVLLGVDITGSGQNIGSVAGLVSSNIGLGSIENCRVTGTVAGSSAVGGVVGNMIFNAYMKGCAFSGDVAGALNIGGVVGSCTDGSGVEESHAEGTVRGEHRVGGVVGLLSLGASVKYCYATCDVIATGHDIGGVAGIVADAGTTVESCFSTGAVSTTFVYDPSHVYEHTNIGGVVGSGFQLFGSSGSVENCVALNPSVTGDENTGRVIGLKDGYLNDVVLSGNFAIENMTAGDAPFRGEYTQTGHDGEDLTSADALTQAFYEALGWDFTGNATDPPVWYMPAGQFPVLYWQNPTVTFDGNGGDPATQTITVFLPDTTVGALPTDPVMPSYRFNGWNTAQDGSGAAFTVTTAVTADMTVYAQWVPVSSTKNYYITASADSGSTISPMGVAEVQKGESKMFAFSAKDGYHITEVLVDKVPLTPEQISTGSYTFSKVMMNHSISVKSAAGVIRLEVTIAEGNGHADYSTNGGSYTTYIAPVQLSNHSGITVAAYADEGYQFSQWKMGGTAFSDPNIYFDDVTSTVHLDLYFERSGGGDSGGSGNGFLWWIAVLIILLAAAGMLIWFFFYRR